MTRIDILADMLADARELVELIERAIAAEAEDAVQGEEIAAEDAAGVPQPEPAEVAAQFQQLALARRAIARMNGR